MPTPEDGESNVMALGLECGESRWLHPQQLFGRNKCFWKVSIPVLSGILTGQRTSPHRSIKKLKTSQSIW
eukprot:1169524-Pleurochrysis_carterae.AAC.2